MVKKYVVEVQEVWVITRKYYTHNDTPEEAIDAYKEGTTIEAFDDYEVIERRFTDKIKDGYEIIDVYED
jgi:hypothetical protein